MNGWGSHHFFCLKPLQSEVHAQTPRRLPETEDSRLEFSEYDKDLSASRCRIWIWDKRWIFFSQYAACGCMFIFFLWPNHFWGKLTLECLCCRNSYCKAKKRTGRPRGWWQWHPKEQLCNLCHFNGAAAAPPSFGVWSHVSRRRSPSCRWLLFTQKPQPRLSHKRWARLASLSMLIVLSANMCCACR